MRRLWAHILIAFAALVAVFASVPALIKNISSDGQFETRRQFVFQLSQRESEEGEEVAKLDKDSAAKMAKIMEGRLISYGVSTYEIKTSGDKDIADIITVNFSADSNEKYQQIVTYLTFSGSFALMNNQVDVVDASQFRNGKAYLKDVTVNDYPTVILPIKTDYSEWDALVQGAVDNATEETEGEGDEAVTTKTANIYLIYNYQKGDTYQTLTESNKLSEKTLLTFSFKDLDEKSDLYYNSSKNSLAQPCGFQDANGNGMADPKEVKQAFNQADYLLNLFNASALDYEVKCIKGLQEGTIEWLEPVVEETVGFDGIAWTTVLTAFVAAFAISSLLVALYFKLGTVSIMTSVAVSVFFGFLFMVVAGIQYNLLSVVALATIGLISLVSGIIYFNKLKEDTYRGHTLKKANTEASKKSLLPILDIHFVALIIGLMTYALGGAALHSFSSILVVGTFISALVNTLGLKGLAWLATNATGLIGKYDAFGIEPENVPNHLAEEKQRFYGKYHEVDFTANKKPWGIAAIVISVLSVTGIILSTALTGGLVKTGTTQVLGNEIYIQNKIEVKDEDSKSDLNENTLETLILNSIEIEQKNKESGAKEYVPLLNFVASKDYNHFEVSSSETVESSTTQYLTTYYVVKLNKIIDLKTNAKLDTEIESQARELSLVLSDFFEEKGLFSSAEENSISIKTTRNYVPQVESPKWGMVALATSISVLILMVYFILRYRLSRGIATILVPVLSSLASLGLIVLFSLVVSFSAEILVVVPVVSIISYFLTVFFMNKERENVIDDKSRDVTYEHREELSIKSLGSAAMPMLITTILTVFVAIIFFGFGPQQSSHLYLILAIGTLIALAASLSLFVPCSNILFKWFKQIGDNAKAKEAEREKDGKDRKNKKKATVKKSAEPEEAIFIGIND